MKFFALGKFTAMVCSFISLLFDSSAMDKYDEFMFFQMMEKGD